MKVEELRIGNWVHQGDGFAMQIVAIFADEVFLNFEGNEGDVWECKVSDIKGFEINTEDLLPLGFIETENNKWEIQIFQETYLTIGFKEYPYYQIGVKGLFFTDMIRIDYVHQVQNLLSSLLPKTL